MPNYHALYRCALGGLAFMFVIGLPGCKPEDGNAAATAPRWESGPEGAWYRGDFHVHTSVGSNDTRGTSWPETIKEVAVARGMDFVVLTDHSNSAGSDVSSRAEWKANWNKGPEFPVWDTAAALSDANFLMINGSEISPVSRLKEDECADCIGSDFGKAKDEPVGHIGCFPADLAAFNTTGIFYDRPPGEVAAKQSIDECHDYGGLAVVNHPFPDVTPWMLYDWTSMEYDAIEVYNGTVAWDLFDGYALDAYLCDRLAGRNVVAIGGSDNHRTELEYDGELGISSGTPLGLPLTTILAPSLTWPNLVEGFKKGRVVVHENASFVEFRIYRGASYVGTVGDSAALSQLGKKPTVWFRGTSKSPERLRLWHVAPNSCQDPRQPHSGAWPTVTKTVVWESDVRGDFEYQAALPLAPGLYFASVGGIDKTTFNTRGIAFTNVFTVTE